MSAGMSKIASGVDGVGIIVAVGGGVMVGTAVGGETVSVAEPPHALRRTIIKIVKRKCLTRTAYTPKNKNGRIILPDFAKAGGGEFYRKIYKSAAKRSLNTKYTKVSK
jgi:hypothetical protein